MNKLSAIFGLSACLLLSAPCFSSAAPEATVHPSLQWVLDNPHKVTTDALRDPANREMVKQLKQYALTKHTAEAVLPLLKLGDPDVIQDCISLYHQGVEGFYSARALAESENPEIIALIGNDLDRNESANHFHSSGEFIVAPLSVRTAGIIKNIIVTSPAFSHENRDWAKRLPTTLSNEEFRQRMRIWWNQNKTLLKVKRYSEVQPPR